MIVYPSMKGPATYCSHTMYIHLFSFLLSHKQHCVACIESLMNIFVSALKTAKIEIPTLKQWPEKAAFW